MYRRVQGRRNEHRADTAERIGRVSDPAVQHVLTLQRGAGNQAVTRVLRPTAAPAQLIQRYQSGAAGSLNELLNAVHANWPAYMEMSPKAQADWIRALMHVDLEVPEPEQDWDPLSEILELFPPSDATSAGMAWGVQGAEGKLLADEAATVEDPGAWPVGLIYYILESGGSGANFRLGINAQGSQSPALARTLLGLTSKLGFIRQFKVPAPKYGTDLLDNTTVYYDDEEPGLVNTELLRKALEDAGVGALTRPEHSGLMEPLRGVPGVGFARQGKGSAYSAERSGQIATALAQLRVLGTPTVADMRSALELANFDLKAPHLAPFADETES